MKEARPSAADLSDIELLLTWDKLSSLKSSLDRASAIPATSGRWSHVTPLLNATVNALTREIGLRSAEVGRSR